MQAELRKKRKAQNSRLREQALLAKGLCAQCEARPRALNDRKPGLGLHCQRCKDLRKMRDKERYAEITKGRLDRLVIAPAVNRSTFPKLRAELPEHERELLDALVINRVAHLKCHTVETVNPATVACELLQVILCAGGMLSYLQQEREHRQFLREIKRQSYVWYLEGAEAY
jgi:hypothetical protein